MFWMIDWLNEWKKIENNGKRLSSVSVIINATADAADVRDRQLIKLNWSSTINSETALKNDGGGRNIRDRPPPYHLVYGYRLPHNFSGGAARSSFLYGQRVCSPQSQKFFGIGAVQSTIIDDHLDVKYHGIFAFRWNFLLHCYCFNCSGVHVLWTLFTGGITHHVNKTVTLSKLTELVFTTGIRNGSSSETFFMVL